MVVKTQTERLKTHPQGRDGALHLRPSARLPDLLGERRLRIAGHGGRSRPARRALRLSGRKSRLRQRPMARPTRTGCRRTSRIPISPTIPSKCIVCSRCVRACEEVQGTFALTIAGRGFDSRVSPGMEEIVPRLRMRVLRRLRAGLPDSDAQRKEDHRDRHAGTFRRDDLRLLRRRLLVQGRNARRRTRAHGALQGWRGEPRPFLRQRPLRLGLRDPQGAHPQTDDPRQGHRSMEGSELGRGDRLRRLRVQAHPGEIRQGIPSAASPRRAAPTKRPSWCRS